jgi:hypothetical protein
VSPSSDTAQTPLARTYADDLAQYRTTSIAPGVPHVPTRPASSPPTHQLKHVPPVSRLAPCFTASLGPSKLASVLCWGTLKRPRLSSHYMAPSRRTSVGYWIIVVALLILGYFTGFTIGPVFWFIAGVMIVLAPFRSRPRIYRTGIALFMGFVIGYVLVAPWACTQSAESDVVTGEQTVSPVVCSSIIGIDYSGPEPFDPSLVPALVSGGVLAAIAGSAAWIAVGRSLRRQEDETKTA